MAYFEDKPIAGILNAYFNKTAIYYYGASSNEYRNLMAPYLLQWHAILDAKENNYHFYDFLGVADPSNPKDPLQGVTYFKQKFGGTLYNWPASNIIIHKPVLYFLLKLKKFLKI
jgi:lipid II:glycine glycyltransferase (peptidoglycan interpeptide bridge formation enzyme)